MSTALSAQTEQMPPLAGRPRQFSKRQKAAIVVRMLLSEGADLSLNDLPEPLLIELTRQMTTLRFIDHATMTAVALEFLAELDGIGLTFPSAMDSALSMLGAAISNETAGRIRQTTGITDQGDPWDRIGGMSSEVLLPVLEQESVEIGAVMLSKLKVSQAAELLGLLPGERARRITYAVSLTGNIAPEVVRRIGGSLASQLDAQPIRAFSEGPVERVGAILNFSPASTREDVLDGLDETDSGFATQVRRAIFTFANIPARIDPRDVPKIIRDVDPDQLITALAAAGETAEATEFILSNMSQRMSTQLREDMAGKGKVAEKDGDQAMNAVVASIRELEAAGVAQHVRMHGEFDPGDFTSTFNELPHRVVSDWPATL